MQPTYQVPWEKLESAFTRLKAILDVEQADACLRKIDMACGGRQGLQGDGQIQTALYLLFLCGVRFQFSYFRAFRNGRDALRQAGAGHLLDDCLDETCKRGLLALMVIAKSRRLRDTISECLTPEVNTEYILLSVAFGEWQKKLPVTISQWLDHGDREANSIRLCFGMGVRSFWDRESNSFISRMMRKPIGIANAKGDSCTPQIKEVIDGFEWSPQWVRPEI